LNENHKIEQVLIVGGGANVPGIGEFFTNELVMAARVASPWQRLDFGQLREPNKQFRPRYIAVAGLASLSNEEVWKK
jgi:type IV pilus assembly protein PilM